MIGHGQWCASPVRVLPYHRDMGTFPDRMKSETFQALTTSRIGASIGILTLDGHPGLGDKGFQNGRINLDGFRSKSLDMKLNRRFHVSQCRLVGLALTNHNFRPRG